MSKTVPDHLEETLLAVDRVTVRSTKDIYGRLSDRAFIGQSAVSNRLSALGQMGFVKSERRGKEKFWRRVK